MGRAWGEEDSERCVMNKHMRTLNISEDIIVVYLKGAGFESYSSCDKEL